MTVDQAAATRGGRPRATVKGLPQYSFKSADRATKFINWLRRNGISFTAQHTGSQNWNIIVARNGNGAMQKAA